ncbi:hypothetical protein TNCV_1617391 [Trichonephila clavipes]|nr:hypothetical protein TNCV_1617391 [Trichonephila clavipes]
MPSCYSVHDLEFAVQDLWAHLPQDNIRCLINLMPDCVAPNPFRYAVYSASIDTLWNRSRMPYRLPIFKYNCNGSIRTSTNPLG